jgi:hypothetical protein
MQSAKRAVQPQPDWHHLLGRSRRADVAQINYRMPAEPLLQEFRDARFGARIIAADKDVVIARHERGIDHHFAVHRIERLDDLGLRERPLNLLAERIGVADRKGRRRSMREVKRIGDVDQNLSFEIVCARRLKRFN